MLLPWELLQSVVHADTGAQPGCYWRLPARRPFLWHMVLADFLVLPPCELLWFLGWLLRFRHDFLDSMLVSYSCGTPWPLWSETFVLCVKTVDLELALRLPVWRRLALVLAPCELLWFLGWLVLALHRRLG